VWNTVKNSIFDGESEHNNIAKDYSCGKLIVIRYKLFALFCTYKRVDYAC